MTQASHSALISRPRSRLRRLPFVLALTLGLLLSLLHCAGDGFAFADGTAAITMNDSGAPDLPDQQMPAHSGHCLSHVTAQAMITIISPAEPTLRAPAFARTEAPASPAWLPLFKPPRA
ncbi:MAG: hypothetical protein JWQ94_908 [Tardiphaga sp.]|jgi:hypothetical protein|nr:hypothetical protein [Tardiphaga sp.]